MLSSLAASASIGIEHARSIGASANSVPSQRSPPLVILELAGSGVASRAHIGVAVRCRFKDQLARLGRRCVASSTSH
jgi:hypothetical protein